MNAVENAAEIQNVEISIAQARVSIARKAQLTRLQQNPDFQALIEKGFMEAHAVRQVMLKAHPALQKEDAQKLLDQQITAIGGFKQFLIGVFTEGTQAEAALAADEETLDELLKEGLENG